MDEYLEMGHMTPVNVNDHAGPKYYIPHREVIREQSSTTPLRVVFNASSSIKKLALAQ